LYRCYWLTCLYNQPKQKRQKKIEQQLNDDFPKSKDEEADIDTEEKMK